MECPRCHEPAPLAALACDVCCAPLRLREEPPPALLDRPLDLDRRRHGRTGDVALAIPPAPLPSLRGQGDEPSGALDLDLAPHPGPLAALREEGDEMPLDLDLDAVPRPSPLLASPGEGEERPVPASLAARALAAAIDTLLVASATAIPVLLAAWTLPGRAAAGTLLLPALALAALVAIAYASLGLGLAGATPGGRLVGLAVTDSRGSAPTMGRAALRAALAIAGTLALGAGLWLALFTDSRQTLHDRVAGTFVVRAP